MKNYTIVQYSGNLNKWVEPIRTIGITNIAPEAADEYNSRFETTGIKYVEIFGGSVETFGDVGVQEGQFKGMKVGMKVGDKILRKVSQGYLDANPLVTGVSVGDLWPM